MAKVLLMAGHKKFYELVDLIKKGAESIGLDTDEENLVVKGLSVFILPSGLEIWQMDNAVDEKTPGWVVQHNYYWEDFETGIGAARTDIIARFTLSDTFGAAMCALMAAAKYEIEKSFGDWEEN